MNAPPPGIPPGIPAPRAGFTAADVALVRIAAARLVLHADDAVDFGRALRDLALRLEREIAARTAAEALRGGTVQLQDLVDAGLNAYAVQLLGLSYRTHVDAPPISFAVDGVQFALARWPADGTPRITPPTGAPITGAPIPRAEG